MYIDIVFIHTYVIHMFLIKLISHVIKKKLTTLKVVCFPFLFSFINIAPMYLNMPYKRCIQGALSYILLLSLFKRRQSNNWWLFHQVLCLTTTFFAGFFLIVLNFGTFNLLGYLACSVICYRLFLRFYQAGINQEISRKQLYTLVITHNKQTVSVSAYYDTGHHLRDPITHAAVLFIDKAIIERLKIDTAITAGKEKQLYYHDINQHIQEVRCIKPARVEMVEGEKKNVVDHVLLGLKDHNFTSEEGYSALFGPQLFTLLKTD